MKSALPLTAFALVATTALMATQPQLHTAPAAELERGEASGMAVTNHGSLFAGPALEPYGSPFPAPEPAQIWAIAGDAAGNLLIGTGPEGRVFKISPQGQTTLFFVADEPMITALATTRQGEVLAAAAPGGVIYRIDADGSGEAWCETDEYYVWALAPVEGERVLAGTGQRGRILEIDADGRFELLFDSQESHIVSLLALPDGGLLAGGAGQGLLYHVDDEGHAMVLHDGELAEVVGLAREGDTVIAALVAHPEPERRSPVLRLRLPERQPLEASAEAAADALEEQPGPTLHGTIEGIPPSAEPEPQELRGQVIRLDASGKTTELWSSTREAPHCLVADRLGRIYFGTGEPGRLYRVGPDGEVARLTTAREAQVTELFMAGDGLLLATANPGRVYRLAPASGEPGEFLSHPVDAGGPARWGSIRWSPAQAAGTELFTRTGSSARPDSTWSAWSPSLRDGSGSRILNPDGRFLQWRVRQTARGEEGVALSRVTLTYEPHNRAPRLAGLRADPPGEWIRGPVTFRWEAEDPDGDPVRVRIEFRPVGDSEWSLAGVAATTQGNGELIWDTDPLPEGKYELRVTASDQAANPLGEGRTAVDRPLRSLVVDRTPPRIEWRAVGQAATEVLVEDEASILRSLELVRDGEVLYTARPEDGVCDARRELFSLELPAGSAGDWSIRGTDAAGNAAERPLVDSGAAD